MNRSKYKISEICDLKYGKMPDKTLVSTAIGSGYPVFSGYGITGYYPEYNFENPEVIVVARGVGGTGDVKISPPKTWLTNLSIALYNLAPNIDKTYLYYYLNTRNLRNLDTGSAQSQITISVLENFQIELPNLDNQKLVSKVLHNYDSLIEKNKKRIKLLEEMAQTIYTEWFVNFRFPGHENVKLVDSELGKIPEGWNVTKLENVIERFTTGKKYNNKTAEETGNVPILDQGKSGIIGYHNNEPGFNASEKNPVIVFANHTCYQRLITFPFSSIQNVIPYKPINTELDITWLHYATKDLISFNDYKGHWPEFISKKVLIPVSELTQLFGSLVFPLLIMSFKLSENNKFLAEIRDLLIPKLISGEIDVSELDIDVEEEND